MATKPNYSLPLQGFFFFPVFVFTAVKCGQSCVEKKNSLLILKCFRVARIKQNVCVPEGESCRRLGSRLKALQLVLPPGGGRRDAAVHSAQVGSFIALCCFVFYLLLTWYTVSLQTVSLYKRISMPKLL